MEVIAITSGHALWHETAAFADACSWRGGQQLAAQMRQNQFHSWERVFVLREDTQMIGFCTLTEKDELPAEYEFTPLIGSVFIAEAFRGQRRSALLIAAATAYAREIGFREIYVMSGETGLYEAYGFSPVGMYPTVFGTTEQLFVRQLGSDGGKL